MTYLHQVMSENMLANKEIQKNDESKQSYYRGHAINAFNY